jgi:type 1 glutamine amidotransferase/sugar phosphate isomerase/epimerase
VIWLAIYIGRVKTRMPSWRQLFAFAPKVMQKGSSMMAVKLSSRAGRNEMVIVAVLSFSLLAARNIFAQTPSSTPTAQASTSAPKAGQDAFKLPSVSVRPPDKGRMRTNATLLLGWRLGVRTDAFGSLTFSDAAAKADAAGLAAVEGVSSQQVSTEIPKKLDYNLTPDEIAKVKDRLDELRLQVPAYFVDVLPSDADSRRKIFEFAKGLGADMVIVPAESSSFSDIDRLASEIGINVAVRSKNPQVAAAALEGLSSHIGLSVDLATWEKAGVKPVSGLEQLKNRLLAADLHNVTNSAQFLLELSRLEPPTIQTNWPPTRDGGAERSPGKPLFFTFDPTSGDLSLAADAYDKAVLRALAFRIDTLSRMQTISSPDAVPADVRAKIDAAIPRRPSAIPAKPRKLLVMDLCVDGGYYHAIIPNANLALQLIGKYTGAYVPTFSNNLDDLKYPNIKQYDAVFLNNVEGELFIDPEVLHGLMRFVREGGGVAGLHATSFASANIPEFGDLIGAQTGAHKYNGEPGTLRIEDPNSPLTKQFGTEDFDLFDEFYHFLPTGPYSRQKLHILLSLDPAKTELSANRYTTRPDNDYGMVWIKSYGKGRVFFCALGHKPEFYENPKMEQLLSAATQFVLGDLKADTTPSAMLATKK